MLLSNESYQEIKDEFLIAFSSDISPLWESRNRDWVGRSCWNFLSGWQLLEVEIKACWTVDAGSISIVLHEIKLQQSPYQTQLSSLIIIREDAWSCWSSSGVIQSSGENDRRCLSRKWYWQRQQSSVATEGRPGSLCQDDQVDDWLQQEECRHHGAQDLGVIASSGQTS